MKFKVLPEIFERYPGLNLGLVKAWGIDNTGCSPDLEEMLRFIRSFIRKTYNSETLSAEPKINAWRNAYSSFGAKPKKYKSSVESLYRMTLKGIDFSINKVVDIYNYISLKYMIPLGGDDLDKIEGDILLGFAAEDKQFIPLNSDIPEIPKIGEVVYMDNNDILCRRWNWRESDKTKMTERTRDVLLVIEALPPFTKEELNLITTDLAGHVKKFCGGEIMTDHLFPERPEVEI